MGNGPRKIPRVYMRAKAATRGCMRMYGATSGRMELQEGTGAPLVSEGLLGDTEGF